MSAYPAALKLRTALHVMLAGSVPVVTHPVHALVDVQQAGIRQRLISLVLLQTTAPHVSQENILRQAKPFAVRNVLQVGMQT